MKEKILYVITLIVVTIGTMVVVWYETTPERMYAGRHDLHCEKVLTGKKCHCYERLVKINKQKEEEK